MRVSRCPAAAAWGGEGGSAVIGREVARGERDLTAVLVSHNDCRWHCLINLFCSLFLEKSAQFLF